MANKSSSEPPSKRCKLDSNAVVNLSEKLPVFKDLRFFVVESGIGKARSNLFRSRITELGGSVSETTCDIFNNIANAEDRVPTVPVTHVVVDDGMTDERLCRILKISASPLIGQVKFVRSAWVSACIKTLSLHDTAPFELALSVSANLRMNDVGSSKPSDCLSTYLPMRSSIKPSVTQADVKQTVVAAPVDSDHDSDYQNSGAEDDDASRVKTEDEVPKRSLPKGNWVCAQPSSGPRCNHNSHITDKLEEMAKKYESINDKWRALGYQKAINTLKRHPIAIQSFEEAKSLPGIGTKLAEKIWEIAESGDLRKLNELTSQDEIKALELFTNVWGAGAQTARMWVQRGYRTLNDLLSDDAGLTRNQRIGLKYYDELLDRMSREEAGQIETLVRDAALSIQPGLTVMACGSYRRGKQTCGDVDVLITHPDGHSHVGVFAELIRQLTETGFLTDHLVAVENNGDQKKYLGVCRLPGENKKHRRLDVIVVPYNEFACALMYFTGSAHFNRSMRNLASRMNMSLNEHALYSGVVRSRGVKVNQGTALHTPTEESVFSHLGLVYRPPEERDH